MKLWMTICCVFFKKQYLNKNRLKREHIVCVCVCVQTSSVNYLFLQLLKKYVLNIFIPDLILSHLCCITVWDQNLSSSSWLQRTVWYNCNKLIFTLKILKVFPQKDSKKMNSEDLKKTNSLWNPLSHWPYHCFSLKGGKWSPFWPFMHKNKCPCTCWITICYSNCNASHHHKTFLNPSLMH